MRRLIDNDLLRLALTGEQMNAVMDLRVEKRKVEKAKEREAKRHADSLLGIKLLPLNTIVALLIAVCKASLVVLFFMHIKYNSSLIKLAAVAGIFWLAILITLTMSDYMTRNMHIPNPPQTWQASTMPGR